jgi:hypothetical protein
MLQKGPSDKKGSRIWPLHFANYIQWIGLRENLQESPIFTEKIYGFL